MSNSYFAVYENHGDLAGGAILPFMCYIGVCGPKEYGFSAVFVIKRAGVDFGHFGHKKGMNFTL